MIVVDPLKDRLFRFIKLGKANPLLHALGGYASPEDLSFLEIEINRIKQEHLLDDARQYIYIDLTPPFVRFKDKKAIVEQLNKFNFPRPVLLIKDIQFFEWAEHNNKKGNMPLVIVFFDKDGIYNTMLGGSDQDTKYFEDIKNDLSRVDQNGNKVTLANIRSAIAQKRLFTKLFEANCVEFPRINYSINESEENSYLLDEAIMNTGRPYKVLSNNMLVSCYLNLKKLGYSITYLMDVVYEIVLNLENYFITIDEEKNNFDCIVTTNNTALFIASLLQIIYEEKNLVPIDKLGPIPSLRLNSETLKNIISGKRVVVFEEVVGSGNELDRSIMFLNHMGSKIVKIIALYDLQVGKPLLMTKDYGYVALCTPKEELKYEYRSK